MSTGTQRMVALGAAVAVGTALVLLDQPFKALDTASLARLQGVLGLVAARPQQAWLVASHPGPLAGDARRAVLGLGPGAPR